jgi:hypothetical protein
MSKADNGLTTSANPTPTRRSILSQTARLAGAAVLGYATVEPAQALAVFSQMAPANENEHADLAEARRLLANHATAKGRDRSGLCTEPLAPRPS